MLGRKIASIICRAIRGPSGAEGKEERERKTPRVWNLCPNKEKKGEKRRKEERPGRIEGKKKMNVKSKAGLRTKEGGEPSGFIPEWERRRGPVEARSAASCMAESQREKGAQSEHEEQGEEVGGGHSVGYIQAVCGPSADR